jgi:hypothetical protein
MATEVQALQSALQYLNDEARKRKVASANERRNINSLAGSMNSRLAGSQGVDKVTAQLLAAERAFNNVEAGLNGAITELKRMISRTAAL